MKNIYAILLATLITCSIVFSPLTSVIHVGYALPGPRIYLDPSANTFYSNVTDVGDRFNVTVWVENVTNVGGAQVYMDFDDSIVNVTRWFEPTSDPQYIFYGRSTSALPTPPNDVSYIHIGPGNGSVLISVSLFPPNPPYFTGTGKICTFELALTAAAPVDGQLTSRLRIDSTNTFLLDGDSGLEIPVTKEDGSYTYIYVRPPPPLGHMWLEASPSSYEAVKERPFNVTIGIFNVSASDMLIGIQFTVNYNSSWLDAVAIYQGPFMNNSVWAPYGTFASFYSEPNKSVYGEIILPNATGEWDMTEWPEGNGTVAIITFLPQQHAVIDANWTFNIDVDPLFGEYFLDKNGEYLSYLPATDCAYTYNPLSLPTLAVNPSLYTASHVGQSFPIEVTIADLAEEWQLTYVEFKLTYNENFLGVQSVTEGSFMSGFGSTVLGTEQGSNYVKVNITLTPSSAYPSGSGVLAVVNFNVTHTPGRCALTLNGTSLLDFGGKVVLHEVEHGYYRLHEVLVHPIVVDDITYNVVTISNASVTPAPMLLNLEYKFLYFNVTDDDGNVGFVDVIIPKALLNGNSSGWMLFIGGYPMTVVPVENATHATLSFNVHLSTKSVFIFGTSIIPEFTFNALLLTFIAVTVIGLAVAKTVRQRKREMLTQFKR